MDFYLGLAQIVGVELLPRLLEVQPLRLGGQGPKPIQQQPGLCRIHHRGPSSIAPTMRWVRRLTVTTRASRSITRTLWSAKR